MPKIREKSTKVDDEFSSDTEEISDEEKDIYENDFYEMPDSTGSCDELLDELAEMELAEIPPEELDLPVIKLEEDRTDFTCSDHHDEHHGFPNDDGSITIYLFCPGCTQAGLDFGSFYNPDRIFQKIEVEVISPTNIYNNSPSPLLPTPSSNTFPLPDDSHSHTPPSPEQIRPNKRRRSASSRKGCNDRKDVFIAKMNFSQVVAESQAANIPEFGLELEAPPQPFQIPGQKRALSCSQHKNIHLSCAAKLKCVQKWMTGILPKRVRTKMEKTYFAEAENTHTDFMKQPRSQKTVQAFSSKIGEEEITDYPETGHLLIAPHSSHPRYVEDPEYLIMRWDNVISKELKDYVWDLWNKFRTDPHYAFAEKKTCKHRSKKGAAAHAGKWSHYSRQPYITRDSKPKNDAAKKALDNFIGVISEVYTPPNLRLLRLHDPAVYENLMIDDKFVKSFPDIQQTLVDRPALDFKGLCQTVAIKEGSSQLPHLDWLDHPGIYAFVICVGPGWKGGKIVYPQLRKAVPTSPGQVIAFQACRLAHFTSEVVGDRLALTCFVDQATLDRALKAYSQVIVLSE